MNHLPAGILELIFGCLYPAEVVSGCSPVSRLWNSTRAAWPRLNIGNNKYLKKAVVTKIQSIGLNYTEDMIYLARMTSLRRLNLNWCGMSNAKDFANLVYIPQLTELDAVSIRITDEGLSSLQNLSELRSLDLGHNNNITDEGLRVLMYLPKLSKLSLGYCESITDEALDLLKFLPELIRLNLERCGITDHGISKLKFAPTLQELDLSSCRSITDSGLRVLEYLPGLRSLKLNGCKKMSRRLEHLRFAPNLLKLSLAWCIPSNRSLKNLKYVPKLQELNLMDCFYMSKRSIQNISFLTELKKLGIVGCYSVEPVFQTRDGIIDANGRRMIPARLATESDYKNEHVIELKASASLEITRATLAQNKNI